MVPLGGFSGASRFLSARLQLHTYNTTATSGGSPCFLCPGVLFIEVLRYLWCKMYRMRRHVTQKHASPAQPHLVPPPPPLLLLSSTPLPPPPPPPPLHLTSPLPLPPPSPLFNDLPPLPQPLRPSLPPPSLPHLHIRHPNTHPVHAQHLPCLPPFLLLSLLPPPRVPAPTPRTPSKLHSLLHTHQQPREHRAQAPDRALRVQRRRL